MSQTAPQALQIYVDTMELTITVKDFYGKWVRKLRVKYAEIFDNLDALYAELDRIASQIDDFYPKNSHEYKSYEKHLQLINEVINKIYTVVKGLKIKSEGEHYEFGDHRQSVKAYHDAYDRLMDSANELKNNPPPTSK